VGGSTMTSHQSDFNFDFVLNSQSNRTISHFLNDTTSTNAIIQLCHRDCISVPAQYRFAFSTSVPFVFKIATNKRFIGGYPIAHLDTTVK
jgi:hypothetical protein